MRTEGGVGGCAAHLVLRGLPSFARVSIGAALPWVAVGFEPPRTLCPLKQTRWRIVTGRDKMTSSRSSAVPTCITRER